eukprot:12918252-Prorocentrum_lima.AAC.1
MRACQGVARHCDGAGHLATKDSDTALAPWELLVRQGFRWKRMHDPNFGSARKRSQRGLDVLQEAAVAGDYI